MPVRTVTLGGTRHAHLGGHHRRRHGPALPPLRGQMPDRPPVVAMEVFDLVSEKYPDGLREVYGDAAPGPGGDGEALRRASCGADLISVRLEGTHPEKGNRSPEQAVELVRCVLEAVDVPLIVTGHNHFEKNNEVMKQVAAAFAGREPPAQLGRDRQLQDHRRRGHGLRPLRGRPDAHRRQHGQAAQHPADQHGRRAGADRHRPHDRRAWATASNTPTR